MFIWVSSYSRKSNTNNIYIFYDIYHRGCGNMMESELPYLIEVVKACKKEQESQQTLKANTHAFHTSNKHKRNKQKRQSRKQTRTLKETQNITSSSRKQETQPFQQPSPFKKVGTEEGATAQHEKKKIILDVGTRIGRHGIRITPLELNIEADMDEELEGKEGKEETQ